jgi:hypothetical protein
LFVCLFVSHALLLDTNGITQIILWCKQLEHLIAFSATSGVPAEDQTMSTKCLVILSECFEATESVFPILAQVYVNIISLAILKNIFLPILQNRQTNYLAPSPRGNYTD